MSRYVFMSMVLLMMLMNYSDVRPRNQDGARPEHARHRKQLAEPSKPIKHTRCEDGPWEEIRNLTMLNDQLRRRLAEVSAAIEKLPTCSVDIMLPEIQKLSSVAWVKGVDVYQSLAALGNRTVGSLGESQGGLAELGSPRERRALLNV
eukprot:jgi/Mesvir1/4508/Mv03787-RA.1